MVLCIVHNNININYFILYFILHNMLLVRESLLKLLKKLRLIFDSIYLSLLLVIVVLCKNDSIIF